MLLVSRQELIETETNRPLILEKLLVKIVFFSFIAIGLTLTSFYLKADLKLLSP